MTNTSFHFYIAFVSILFLSTNLNSQLDSLKTAQEADSLFNLVYKNFRANPELAEEYAKKSLSLYEKTLAADQAILAANALYAINFSLGDNIDCISYSKKALDLLEKFPDHSASSLSMTISNSGAQLNESGNYIAAIKVFEKIYSDSSINKDTSLLSKMHSNLSINYNLINDFKNSELHYDKALEYLGQSVSDSYSLELSKAYRFWLTNEFEKSKATLFRIVENTEENEIFKYNLHTTHRLISKSETKLNNQESALKHAKLSFENIDSSNTLQLVLNYINLGNIHAHFEDFQLAIENYNQAINVINDSKKGFTQELATAHFKIGDSYFSIGDHNKALENINLGIQLLSPEALNNNEEVVLDKILLRELYYLKSKVMKASSNDVNKILQTYSNTISKVLDSRSDINNSHSRVIDVSTIQQIFNDAINAALDIYIQSQNTKHLWKALYWADLSKSMTLVEEQQIRQNVQRYSQDSSYLKYTNLYAEIQNLYSKVDESADSLKSIYQEELIKKQIELSEFNENYYDRSFLSFESFKNTYSKKRFLLTKETNEQYLFFSNSSNALNIKSIKKGVVLERLEKIRSSIQLNEQLDGNLLFELNELMGFSNLENGGRTMIIPDGAFYDFPFELLIRHKEKSKLRNLPNYALFETTLQYGYSLQGARKKENSISNKNRLLAYAPTFDSEDTNLSCNSNTYASLSCNTKELEKIQQIKQGLFYLSKEATVSNFQKNADQADMIHFATHACIDRNNYYNSHVALSDGVISLSELYHYDWNDKRIILSTCSSASGKDVKGEGVFSLARSLLELGCSEVLVSLWPISDCVASDLLPKVYENLKQSNTLSDALNFAKIQYLESKPDHLVHPYYWSSFIVFSNSISNGSSQNSRNFIISIVLLSILLTSIFVSKKYQLK